MSKLNTLFMVALLSTFMLAYYATGRTEPGLATDIPTKSHLEVLADQAEKKESCEGVGKEDCLIRRTLAAHVDYIYTQKHNP